MLIPYEEIDPTIRGLVRLINQFPGLYTTDSCAGHRAGEPCYISVGAETQDAFLNLIRALPFWGHRGGFVNTMPWINVIWAWVMPGEETALSYVLHLEGHPLHAQRELIGQAEESLRDALTHLSDTHSPCSKRVSVYNEGTESRSRSTP